MISVDDIFQGYDYGAKLVSDPECGFHVGTRYHLSSYGMLWFAILSSTKFEQALSHIQKYHQAVQPTLEVSFSYYSCKSSLICRVVPLPARRECLRLHKFIVDMRFRQLLTGCRDILGDEFGPTAINFSYPKKMAGQQIRRAHVRTPVTNAHLVCCLML